MNTVTAAIALLVVLAALAADSALLVPLSPGVRKVHQNAATGRTFDAHLSDADLRERRMHPDIPFRSPQPPSTGLRDSADDHGDNVRPAGPVEEQDASFWISNARSKIESELLQRKEIRGVAKNVIIFMGDGMSIPTLAATRVYAGGENAELSFEKFPAVGLSKTYCVDTQVADSACSATAYLCGVKANMGTMGLSAAAPRHNCSEQQKEVNHVDSVLAWGMRAGKWAGVVTTTRITHASPGGTYAHIANRDWEDDSDMAADLDADDVSGCKDIARQLVEDAPGRDFRVIMGGGRRGFLPKTQDANGRRADGRDLIETWKKSKEGSNFRYLETRADLESVDTAKTDYLLGLFEWDHIQYHLDADQTQPSLKQMVHTAIDMLSKQEKGFVLFVEGGRIDHGHHDSQAHYALDETSEFSAAIQEAVDMTKEEETLIVVTSDHAHTMSLAGYAARGNDIFQFAGHAADKAVYTTLSYANGPGYYLPDEGGHRHDPSKDDTGNKAYKYPATALLDSETHGGDDVGIFARGPWAHLYTGVHEQSMIPHIAAYAAAIGHFEGRSSAAAPQLALAAALLSFLVTRLASAML